jgi:hypothetical protein
MFLPVKFDSAADGATAPRELRSTNNSNNNNGGTIGTIDAAASDLYNVDNNASDDNKNSNSRPKMPTYMSARDIQQQQQPQASPTQYKTMEISTAAQPTTYVTMANIVPEKKYTSLGPESPPEILYSGMPNDV